MKTEKLFGTIFAIVLLAVAISTIYKAESFASQLLGVLLAVCSGGLLESQIKLERVFNKQISLPGKKDKDN